jgi:hypothetical protein
VGTRFLNSDSIIALKAKGEKSCCIISAYFHGAKFRLKRWLHFVSFFASVLLVYMENFVD